VTAQVSDLLVAAGLVKLADVQAVLQRQSEGGRQLADMLVTRSVVDRGELGRFLKSVPAAPLTIADTGLGEGDLVNLRMKIIYIKAVETTAEFREPQEGNRSAPPGPHPAPSVAPTYE
jgi:hypothetical protein